MEQKQRFINLAQSGHFTVTELCAEFGITRKTGHKWLGRYAAGGREGLEEHSRAPHQVTGRTCAEVERLIVSVAAFAGSSVRGVVKRSRGQVYKTEFAPWAGALSGQNPRYGEFRSNGSNRRPALPSSLHSRG
jgi:transposase-like protein